MIASLLLAVLPASAQLAITEMMSASARTFGQTTVTNNSDFWELTNFGTNAVNLAGYRFSDAIHGLRPLVPNGAPPLLIQTNESVIFVRNSSGFITEADIRARWGSCLGSNVQVRFYADPGFSSFGDGLRVYDPQQRLVDSVDFDQALRGVSFVYDPNSGALTNLSIAGEGGACRAENSDDVGSPGVTTGPIPLRIVRQPMDLTGCALVDAVFTVDVVGIPRPRFYQWFFNGVPILRANQARLVVTNATAANEGFYSVSVDNGFTALHSSNATLTISTNLSAPVIVVPAVDSRVVPLRTARFSVTVCAFPVATYQWFSNGVALPGATSRTLFIPNCTLAMSGTEYCVRAENSLGSVTNCARLYVTAKPDLRITEVQANPDCDRHFDWFEVTNFGTNDVDLLGYRFSDGFILAGAKVVTQPMIIRPNESVVFVQCPAAGYFIDWWGADLVPRDLKVFPYGGFSLNNSGDALYLWNATAEQAGEVIHSVSFARGEEGVSLRFDLDSCFPGCDSVLGELGAFRSSECDDIGSPGYIINRPHFVSIQHGAAGANITWRGVAGATYRLEYSATPQTDAWILVGEMTAINTFPRMTDPGAIGASQRFYRVGQLTP